MASIHFDEGVLADAAVLLDAHDRTALFFQYVLWVMLTAALCAAVMTWWTVMHSKTSRARTQIIEAFNVLPLKKTE
ncbi:MAG TPA: hypothetical protein VKD22_14265 [Ramlibacter sp.]|nr:hypothetical protein [Ramlibacter sp.]